MNSINGEIMNTSQENELPSKIQTSSDTAEKMEQQSDERAQNQNKNSLLAKIEEAEQSVNGERRERFSQLGNSALRTIAEQNVISDVDREDARNELKRREGNDYREPENKTTISGDEFEAFTKDMRENMYGIEKNNAGKYEVWTPTRAQREYLEAKKAGQEDVKYPAGEIKQTASEYDTEKIIEDAIAERLTDEYIKKNTEKSTHFLIDKEGYNKEIKTSVKEMVIDTLSRRRKQFSQNPELIQQTIFNTAIDTFKINLDLNKDKSPSKSEILSMTTDSIIEDANNKAKIRPLRLKHESTSKEIAKNFLNEITDITDTIFKYDINQAIKKQPEIADLDTEEYHKQEQKAILRTLREGKFAGKLLQEKPEDFREFISRYDIKDEDIFEVALRNFTEIPFGARMDFSPKMNENLDKLYNFYERTKNEIFSQVNNDETFTFDSYGHLRPNHHWYFKLYDGKVEGVKIIPNAITNLVVKELENMGNEYGKAIKESKHFQNNQEKILKSEKETAEKDLKYIWNTSDLKRALEKAGKAMKISSEYIDTSALDIDLPTNEQQKISQAFGNYLNFNQIAKETLTNDLEFTLGTEQECYDKIKEDLLHSLNNGFMDTELFASEIYKDNKDKIGLDFSSPKVYKAAFGGWVNAILYQHGVGSDKVEWYFENILGQNMAEFTRMLEERQEKEREMNGRRNGQFTKALNASRFYQEQLKATTEAHEDELEDIEITVLENDIANQIWKNAAHHINNTFITEETPTQINIETKREEQEKEYHEHRESKAVPENFGNIKVCYIHDLANRIKERVPDAEIDFKIQKFGTEQKTQEIIHNNILNGNYPSNTYYGFTFNYNGKPCAIFDNIGNSADAGYDVVRCEPGEDPLFYFTRNKEAAREDGRRNGKYRRFNHKQYSDYDLNRREMVNARRKDIITVKGEEIPNIHKIKGLETIDETMERLEQRAMYFLNTGEDVTKTSYNYETREDLENKYFTPEIQEVEQETRRIQNEINQLSSEPLTVASIKRMQVLTNLLSTRQNELIAREHESQNYNNYVNASQRATEASNLGY